MKLNAHELAMNRWPDNKGTELGSSASDGQLGARIGCVFAITEVAQPLQDRVEELEAAGNAMRKMLLEVRSEVMDDEGYASDLSDVIDNWNAIFAKATQP